MVQDAEANAADPIRIRVSEFGQIRVVGPDQ
jgi:hypothetical protein